jgi:TRAP-type mannitol/chloroaromatic compound transport system permease large subunit
VIGWVGAAWLLLAGSTVLLFVGLPVAFAFLVINLLGAWLWLGGEPGLAQLARNSVSSVMSFSLTPIPLFVLMGEVLFHTGLAVKVIDGIERLIAQVPGRLAVVAVVAGTVFSAISGSTIATTGDARLADGAGDAGARLSPDPRDRPGDGDRRRRHADSAVGAHGPARIALGISISKLLIGGVVPGLVLALAFVAWIVVRVRMKPSLAPNAPLVRHPGFARFKPFLLYVLPLVSIFAVVVGAMAAGWGTPTESAAVGALATIVFAMAYRALSWRSCSRR